MFCYVYFLNSVYVYGARCSITLLTVLDIEQNILRLSTFHCVSNNENGRPGHRTEYIEALNFSLCE